MEVLKKTVFYVKTAKLKSQLNYNNVTLGHNMNNIYQGQNKEGNL